MVYLWYAFVVYLWSICGLYVVYMWFARAWVTARRSLDELEASFV